jgi:hypothetical protein
VAKAKPAKSSKSQPAATSKSKAPAAKSVTPTKPVKKSASVESPLFTGIAIGHAAGDVWGSLSGGEPRTIAEIKKTVKAPGDVVVAALGWLAREDKLEFITNGKTVKIGLK